MDVFRVHSSVIQDYAEYVRSFVGIRDRRLDRFVSQSLPDQTLWPQPLIQMNPSFEPGGWIDDLVGDGVLHPECKHIYRGRQGADVALLVRRLREACEAPEMLCVGTSATLATGASDAEQRIEIASVAWYRTSINLTLEHFSDEYLERASTSPCPDCGHKVSHPVLIVGQDRSWEFRGEH